jgi:hypothetical protein
MTAEEVVELVVAVVVNVVVAVLTVCVDVVVLDDAVDVDVMTVVDKFSEVVVVDFGFEFPVSVAAFVVTGDACVSAVDGGFVLANVKLVVIKVGNGVIPTIVGTVHSRSTQVQSDDDCLQSKQLLSLASCKRLHKP